MNDIPTFTPKEIDAVDLPDGAVPDGMDMPTPSDYLSFFFLFLKNPIFLRSLKREQGCFL